MPAERRDLSSGTTQDVARDRVTGESLTSHEVQEPQAALRATAKSRSLGAARVPKRASLSESRMRETRPSGSMSGE